MSVSPSRHSSNGSAKAESTSRSAQFRPQRRADSRSITNNTGRICGLAGFRKARSRGRGEAFRLCVGSNRLPKKRVQPILGKIGQGIFDFGEDPGAANVVKLCGNFLVASTVEALAEMMVLAEKNDISKKAVADMIGKFSPMHKSYADLIAEGKFQPAGFRLALGLKDINLDPSNRRGERTPMPFASLIHDRWLAAWRKAAKISIGRQSLSTWPNMPESRPWLLLEMFHESLPPAFTGAGGNESARFCRRAGSHAARR